MFVKMKYIIMKHNYGYNLNKNKSKDLKKMTHYLDPIKNKCLFVKNIK